MKPLPFVEELNELFNYDPDTGLFTWKKTLSNRAVAGSIAGSLQSQGYIYISINGKKYSAHRLAYKVFHGSDPVDQIDHIDMDKSNNRIANLRDATNTQNSGNTGPYKTNTSGIKGVYWVSGRKKWRARIMCNGKKIDLGYYQIKEEAALAYEKAAKEYFGDFARTE